MTRTPTSYSSKSIQRGWIASSIDGTPYIASVSGGVPRLNHLLWTGWLRLIFALYGVGVTPQPRTLLKS